jgi:hypothetical protein
MAKVLDTDVPFVSNTPDDKQCLQAAYSMIRQYFQPDLKIAPDEWASLTGFVPEKGTWSMAGLMWFKDHGYEVVHMGTFDYGAFAEFGGAYLIEALGEEIGNWEIKYTDLVVEQARAVRFLESNIWVQRAPTLDDIRQFLRDGYLVKGLVNLNTLNGKMGYLGHAVVVKGFTDTEFIIHDPGLPARPNRHVRIEKFADAWIDPVRNSQKLDAIRPQLRVAKPKVSNTNDEPAVAVA